MKFSKITLLTDYPIQDFAYERNRLLDQAKSDWVLFVDSDETASDELLAEIERIKETGKYLGYLIKRQDYFFGKWLSHGETGNIRLLRLGKREAGRWSRKVHEVWEIDGQETVGELKGVIKHTPHKNIYDLIKKINFYSDIDAKEFGKPHLWDWAKPGVKFFQNYFLRLGFLDGMAGFVHAWMMAFQSLAIRVKQYDFSKTSPTAW
jgi:glycosyltransferase involved in cell wall biosynthesis